MNYSIGICKEIIPQVYNHMTANPTYCSNYFNS